MPDLALLAMGACPSVLRSNAAYRHLEGCVLLCKGPLGCLACCQLLLRHCLVGVQQSVKLLLCQDDFRRRPAGCKVALRWDDGGIVLSTQARQAIYLLQNAKNMISEGIPHGKLAIEETCCLHHAAFGVAAVPVPSDALDRFACLSGPGRLPKLIGSFLPLTRLDWR